MVLELWLHRSDACFVQADVGYKKGNPVKAWCGPQPNAKVRCLPRALPALCTSHTAFTFLLTFRHFVCPSMGLLPQSMQCSCSCSNRQMILLQEVECL